MFRLLDGNKRPVDLHGIVAGPFCDVFTEPDGGFWLGSTEGLAHYAPRVWATPGAVESVRLPVHSITEDDRRRLWFSASEYLLELDGSTWRKHRLPPGFQTHSFQTDSIWPLTGRTGGRCCAGIHTW